LPESVSEDWRTAMTVLLTGGTGYIGSHTAAALIQDGYEVILLDNLSNSTMDVVKKLETLVGREVPFLLGDLRNPGDIEMAFMECDIDCVIHFAGLKAVGESVKMPDLYYANNVGGTTNLIKTMTQHGVKKMVFSSSATVYGNPDSSPIKEDSPLRPTNPYGKTKLAIERMLQDVAQQNTSWQITLLRYFNPVGAHQSGLLGENPKGIPNNLMPYIQQVAAGQRECLNVFGNDYPTLDGTGVRDYIHVCDLAEGHLAALKHLNPGVQIYNLGTGKGASVLEVAHTFEKVNGIRIPTEFSIRREGDVPIYFAATDKARDELGWQSTRTLEDMCKDAWNFYSKLI
jgi:UDP-glucose 4-epimerase